MQASGLLSQLENEKHLADEKLRSLEAYLKETKTALAT